MNTIRLGCSHCDNADMDEIGQEDLEQAVRNGWSEVEELQSYAKACREVAADDPKRSVFDRWTHLGLCPECSTVIRR